MIFKSKIDFFTALLIVAEAWLCIALPLWIGLPMLLVIAILFVAVVLNTYDEITPENILFIKCGFLSTYEMECNKIYSALSRKGLGGLESSLALSFDRIATYDCESYGRKSVLVSPKRKFEFTRKLNEINPNTTIAI